MLACSPSCFPLEGKCPAYHRPRGTGKYFLLVDNMLVVLGFFVVFPHLDRFVDQMGWAALMVGIALGLRQFVQQGLGVFGGAIADRFGAKPDDRDGACAAHARQASHHVVPRAVAAVVSCFLSGMVAPCLTRRAPVVKLIRPQHRGDASSQF